MQFLIGLFAGTVVGFLAAALCAASSDQGQRRVRRLVVAVMDQIATQLVAPCT